jgi:hypothetical protein
MLFFGEVVCKARAKLEALSCSFSGSFEVTLEIRCEHASTCVSYSTRYGFEFLVRSLAILCKDYREFPGTERSVTAGKDFFIRHT